MGKSITLDKSKAFEILDSLRVDKNMQSNLLTRSTLYRISEINDFNLANAILDQSLITPEMININLKLALKEFENGVEINNNKLTNNQIALINSVDSEKLLRLFLKEQLNHFESFRKLKPIYYNKNINAWKSRLDNLIPNRIM